MVVTNVLNFNRTDDKSHQEKKKHFKLMRTNIFSRVSMGPPGLLPTNCSKIKRWESGLLALVSNDPGTRPIKYTHNARNVCLFLSILFSLNTFFSHSFSWLLLVSRRVHAVSSICTIDAERCGKRKRKRVIGRTHVQKLVQLRFKKKQNNPRKRQALVAGGFERHELPFRAYSNITYNISLVRYHNERK